MSAKDFNRRQIESGIMSTDHITKLVEFWQRRHDLVVDGYAGTNTLDSILIPDEPKKIWPLPLLLDGRKPIITSGFYTENASRSTHRGVDMFYKWLDSDPDMPTGDGGAIKKRGQRRWWYPEGAVAIAAASGVVMQAGHIRTGHRLWINHGNGIRTGYFHGSSLLVEPGQKVGIGDPIMVIGDSDSGRDAKHLHFEVSPKNTYAPMNPRAWLRDAKYR